MTEERKGERARARQRETERGRHALRYNHSLIALFSSSSSSSYGGSLGDPFTRSFPLVTVSLVSKASSMNLRTPTSARTCHTSRQGIKGARTYTQTYLNLMPQAGRGVRLAFTFTRTRADIHQSAGNLLRGCSLFSLGHKPTSRDLVERV